MARFDVKVATELVKTSVQLMMTVHPITDNTDIDKYRGACIDILRLKYNDTKALRSFCDGLSVLVMNTYNEEYNDLIEMGLEFSPSNFDETAMVLINKLK